MIEEDEEEQAKLWASNTSRVDTEDMIWQFIVFALGSLYVSGWWFIPLYVMVPLTIFLVFIGFIAYW